MRNALTTPYIPVDGHAPRANRWLSKEASLCDNGLVFLLCGELCFYGSIRTAAVDGKMLKKTALFILTLTTWECFYGFVGILYFSTKEGRETVENHLIHTSCTSSYQRMHKMTSILVDFSWCLFLRKQVCLRKSLKFAPSENIPLYGISLKVEVP